MQTVVQSFSSFRDMDLTQVQDHVRTCVKTVDLIEEELIILRKIIYKNSNQHRRAQYFQYLIQV
jgi:hypothetical protein